MEEREAIERYYDNGVETEWTRLDRHPLEFELSIRHISDFLHPSSRIADVGGGPGKYAIHLAKLGHRVTIVDLSAANLRRARRETGRESVEIEQYLHLSASDLSPLGDESFDAVLCLGPFYHITDTHERYEAISECARILKSDGTLVAAFLSPFAHAISLIAKDRLEHIGDTFEELRYTLEHHQNHVPSVVDFTHAWYADPGAIPDLFECHGLKTERVACLEPLGMPSKDYTALSPDNRSRWLDYLYEISTERTIIGATQHILYCGRKTGQNEKRSVRRNTPVRQHGESG